MTVVHCRIDDRLIHGQVTTAWCRQLPVNRIVVADDAAAADPFQMTLLTMAAPSGVPVSILSLARVVHYLTAGPGQREGVFLLVRTPRDLLALLDAGLSLEEANLGNQGYVDGAVQLHRSIALTREAAAQLVEIAQRGVHLIAAMLPTDRPREILDDVRGIAGG